MELVPLDIQTDNVSSQAAADTPASEHATVTSTSEQQSATPANETNIWLIPANIENITPLNDHDLNRPPALATMLGQHTVNLTPTSAAQQITTQPDLATPPLPGIEEQRPLLL